MVGAVVGKIQKSRIGRKNLLRGFRSNERLRETTLAAVRHIAVDDSALGCLVESRGQSIVLLFGSSGVTPGESGTEFFLTRLDRGDHGSIEGVTLEALARAFF